VIVNTGKTNQDIDNILLHRFVYIYPLNIYLVYVG